MDARTRWTREEIAALYDRAQYLAGQARQLPRTDAPAVLIEAVATRLEAAADVLAAALGRMDRDILARDAPTAFCPYCRMTAELDRDEEGRTWRVCRYCGCADILATTNADELLATRRQTTEKEVRTHTVTG